jgi:hypothetical protein
MGTWRSGDGGQPTAVSERAHLSSRRKRHGQHHMNLLVS